MNVQIVPLHGPLHSIQRNEFSNGPLKGSLNSGKTENERMGEICSTFKWAFI
jgi:hypothetical protein